jgi:hypothetical protein
MNIISYNDSQNQVSNIDNNNNDYLDSKIKNIGDLFKNTDNKHIYNIYKKLYDKNEIFKTYDIETVIYIIHIFIRKKNIIIKYYKDLKKYENVKKQNSTEPIIDIYFEYIDIFQKIHNNNDIFLSTLFITYLEILYKMGIYEIIMNL